LRTGFALRGPLTIDDGLDDKIKAFSPDAIVTVSVGTEGAVTSYNLELLDVPLKTVVWKATMSMYASRDRVPAFADMLVKRFKGDGIVPDDCTMVQPNPAQPSV
jgi:hypothetical protein